MMTTKKSKDVIARIKASVIELSLDDDLSLACDTRYVVITNNRNDSQHIIDTHYTNTDSEIECILLAVYSA